MTRHAVVPLSLALLAGASAGCTDARDHAQAVCALVDTSGTYSDQREEVVRWLARGVVPRLEPGDSLIVIRIDSSSYSEEDVVLSTTIDTRPSRANAAKREAAEALDAFAAERTGSRFTDISGAMMLGAERLTATGAASRVMLVFSDLQEELPRGAIRNFAPTELADVSVGAIRVKRLASDARNPSHFRKRLASWEARARGAGAADWRVLQEPAQLEAFLTLARP